MWILALTFLRENKTATVAYADLELGPARTKRQLLLDLGATPNEMGRVLNVEPESPPEPET